MPQPSEWRRGGPHFHVMAHEGMHAITGTVLGIRVRKVELKRNGDGLTQYRVPAVGGRVFLAGFAGYLGLSAFGLAAAGLIKLGLIVAALWAAVIFLALLLLKVPRPRPRQDRCHRSQRFGRSGSVSPGIGAVCSAPAER